MRNINPINNNGSIQLRFSFGGKRYSFNPIPGGDYDNKKDLATAKAIASKIQDDILTGHFDHTLERYRLASQAAAKYQPKTLLELWDSWVESLDLPPATQANHYRAVRQMLVKAKPAIGDTTWLTKATIAPATFNKRLNLLKSCGRWAVQEGLLEASSFQRIKPRRVPRQVIRPFNTNEIHRIVSGFQELAPHYVPFVKFLFLTGARLSEAIGLRWGHVDFYRNELTICESLSKDVTGNGYQRVRKETKNGTVRHLAMSPELSGLLADIKSTKVSPDDLVFKSHEGYVISSENFRRRYWAKVLDHYQIPYRKPNTVRHTTLSMAIEQGTPITGVAYLAGHVDTTMVIQTYGHLINRPRLPDMPI